MYSTLGTKYRGRKRKRKANVVTFDEEDRREFLTGFRKRKKERQMQVKEQNERKEKEARKEIITEVRDFAFCVMTCLFSGI